MSAAARVHTATDDDEGWGDTLKCKLQRLELPAIRQLLYCNLSPTEYIEMRLGDKVEGAKCPQYSFRTVGGWGIRDGHWSSLNAWCDQSKFLRGLKYGKMR